MKIDRKTLNLVVELPREGEANVIAHSSALPAEVVEQYHGLAGPTMNALIVGGYGYYAPRYAASVLREVASQQAELGGGVDHRTQDAASARAKERIAAFFAEIRRRTHVLSLTDSGWEMVPLGDATKAGTVDDEEVSQIENALVFFTFGLRSWVKAQRDAVSGGLSLCNARIESLNCTELMRSLPTSMTDDSSGASQDASPASSPGSQAPDSKNSSPAPISPGPAHPRIAIVS